MSIKKTFLILGVVISLLILGLIVINTQTIRMKNELLGLNDWRYQAFKISAELRESSDVLTRNACQYIITRQPIFKKRYHDVLDIRNGNKPRPDGVTIPFRVLIERLNLNEEEISKFRLSQDRSNELALKEMTAMNAVEGLFEDGTGSFSKKGKPDFEMAKDLVFGLEYNNSKTLIMEPIKEVEELINNRSKTVFIKAQARENLIARMGLGVLVFFVFSLFFSFMIIRRKIISPLSAAKPILESIGKGNFEARWHVRQNDEIGELSSTLNRMIENIQIQTAELNKSEFRNKTILNTTNEGFWIINNDRNTTEVNPEMCRILARQVPEIIGKNILDFVDEDNKKIWRDQFKIRDKGARSLYEISLQRPDGSLVPCLFNATPLFDEKGDKVGSFAMVTDITERKDKEQIALLGSEIGEVLISSNTLRNKLQTCTEAFVSHLGAAFARIWTVDSKENMLNLQASAGLYTRIDGSRARVQIGKKKIGIIAKEGKPYINKNLFENSLLDDKNWARENGLVSFYGYPMLVEGRVVGVLALFFRTFLSENLLGPLPSIANAIAIAIERERAEQALQREERKFRGFLDSAPDAMVIVDSDGEIKLVNKQTEKLFGYTREELIGQEIEILVAEFIKKKHKKLRADFMRETDVKNRYVNREFFARRKDGNEFPVDISLSPIETESGVWISAAVRDITARKEAEKRLRLTQFVVDNASDTIFWIEPDTARLIYVNEHACRKLGYSREELLSKDIPDFDPEFPIETWQEFSRKLKNGENQMFESKHKNSAGDIFPVEVTAKYIEFDKQGFIMAFVRDITERKKVEEKLVHSNFQADTALELTKSGYWHVPLDGSGWFNSSKRACDIFGDIPNPEFRYRVMEDWFTHVKEGDEEAAANTLENFTAAVEGRIPAYDSIYSYKRPIDGKVVWIHAFGSVVKDENGKPADMYGVTQDITDYVKAEEELKEHMKDLERFSRLTINREEKMIQLKEEINNLLCQMGDEKKYKIVD